MSLSPFRPQVPCGVARLSTFAPPGTLETGGTQHVWPPRYPGDWWDSVLSAPQVPYRLVGLSPFGHQVTLELVHMAGHAYQEIDCVYIPWRPSTGALVRAKRENRGLVYVCTCIYLSFRFITSNGMSCI